MSQEESQETLQIPEAGNAPALPSQGWRKTFSALRNPNYRYFYAGQTVSLIGTWTRTAALGWVAFQFSHSEFVLGTVFMLNSLPIFLFAIYAGSLADRVPKIRIFTVTSWCALLSSLTLAVMLFRGPARGPAPTVRAGTAVTVDQLTDSQRKVLAALCRPYGGASHVASPASNQQIAAELYLSLDAVKANLRSMYQLFGVASLPQNQKRGQLAERAIAWGLVRPEL